MKTVIKIAQAAGFVEYELEDHTASGYDIRYERFAELVRADERAKLAEQPATTPEVVAHVNSNGVVYAAGYPWSDAEILRPLVYGDVQPAQQEPVAWEWRYIYSNGGYTRYLCHDLVEAKGYDQSMVTEGVITPLYASPQAQPAQRTWVGLSQEEINYKAKKDDHAVNFALGALWAEAKLKEKNT